MKELDFDELDRAVNSLMTNVPKTDAPGEDTIKTLNLTPSTDSSPTTSTPIVDPDSSGAVDVAQGSPVTARNSSPVPPAAQRGGRFMDVVHASSDMKKPETPRPVSRQGVTIASSSASAESVISDSNQPTAELKKPETVVATGSSDTAAEWPDPLELANFKTELTPTDTSLQEPDTTSSGPDLSEEPSPLTSPFLPDTKVEKRPLGGAVVGEESVSPVSNVGSGQDKLTVDNPDDQLPATPPREVEVPLPEELHGDLVAIESGAASLGNQEEAADSKSETLAPAVTPTKKESSPTQTGPVSIPQQYHEEPSTGESANGSIYDTDSYHQPLTHPAKKKSGWLWVLWIVLILIAGVGIALALYFFGIV